MNIMLNGINDTLPAQSSIKALLELKNIKPHGVVVEVNGSIIKSAAWANTLIPENAQIELITFVGGG